MADFYASYPLDGAGGGTGTVTSVAMTVPSVLSVSGSPITTSGTLAVTYSGTALPVANGGTGQTSLGNLTDTGTDGIVVTGGTGAVITSASIAQHVADTTHNGYLSSTDWNTFNNKQPTITTGNLTDAGTDGIVVTGGTGAVIGSGTSLAQHVADTTHNGYLSSTDWNTFNGKGSVSSVAMTVPSVLSVSGSPVTGSGTLAVSYSGTALPIANGGTAVTSVTTAPAATAFAGWDANKNLSANNHIEAYTTTATAAGTTTLVVGSTYLQYFTGSTTQTVVLPVTSTLVLGQQFQIVNSSSGVVTVQSSGANTVQAMAANTNAVFTCILTSGTSAASWSVQYSLSSSTGTVTSVAMTVPSLLSISGSPITTSGTLALSYSGTALPIANGGTGQTTAAAAYNALSPMTTIGDIEYESGANTASRLAGNTTSTKNFLTQTGTGSASQAPAWGTIVTADLPATVQFLANTSSTAATTSAPFKFTNVITDTNSAYSSGTGIWTCQVAGTYMIIGSAFTGGAFSMKIYYNGAIIQQGTLGAVAGPSFCAYAKTMAVNDTIQLRPDSNQTANGDANLNYFSVTKF